MEALATLPRVGRAGPVLQLPSPLHPHLPTRLPLSLQPPRLCRARAVLPLLRCQAAASDPEPAFAGEGSTTTVFPGEACDELGGEFCDVEGVGPEVKAPAPANPVGKALKGILDVFKPEVGTVDYDGAKTVFPGEACDELGGEFCEPEYQEGVGKEIRQ